MREARSTGMKMLAIAQLKGWAEMEDYSLTTDQQEEEEFMGAQLAVVETETVELPSLGTIVPIRPTSSTWRWRWRRSFGMLSEAMNCSLSQSH